MTFPFNLTVYVFTRPNLRDDGLDMERYIGRSVLDSLFDDMESRPDVETLMLSFPEQWLNIIEQRVLFSRLMKYCPNLKEVTVKTHSVYIIQTTPNGCCKILKGPENTPTPGESSEGRLYFEGESEELAFLNRNGLSVLHGTVTKSKGLPPVEKEEFHGYALDVVVENKTTRTL